MDAIEHFARHVVSTRFDAISASAIDAAEALVLDTIGVGIGGSAGPMARELAQVQAQNGASQDAHVWSTGERLSAPAAALCNAYQVHNSEFDCIHEAAVAHVLSAVVPVALAHAERVGGISGRRFLEAVVLGADVASTLGVSAASGLRFFRPATVGAFGATAALGKLMGFDEVRLVHAFSIAYGQLCGTMQAHEEGSMLLALQMGFNARNAVVACDMAAAGFTGPKNILGGRFGYFGLFEAAGDIDAQVPSLGRNWRIEEVAHKPFPSGRATHGVLDACLTLQRRHGFAADAIERIEATVPPLVGQLVGRPYRGDMDINYARLCAPYVAARGLVRGGVIDLGDFSAAAYAEPATRRLAGQVSVRVRDGDSPNVLTPVDVRITLTDGRVLEHRVEHVYGAPANPMSRAAQLEKFRANCAAAARPLPEGQVEQLIEALSALREADDVCDIVALTVA